MAANAAQPELVEIPLPRPCPGTKLLAFIRLAVREAGGEMEETVERYYCPAGTSHAQPAEVTLKVAIGSFFLREFEIRSLDLKKTDHERLVLVPRDRLPQSHLQKFIAALAAQIEKTVKPKPAG